LRWLCIPKDHPGSGGCRNKRSSFSRGRGPIGQFYYVISCIEIVILSILSKIQLNYPFKDSPERQKLILSPAVDQKDSLVVSPSVFEGRDSQTRNPTCRADLSDDVSTEASAKVEALA